MQVLFWEKGGDIITGRPGPYYRKDNVAQLGQCLCTRQITVLAVLAWNFGQILGEIPRDQPACETARGAGRYVRYCTS